VHSSPRNLFLRKPLAFYQEHQIDTEPLTDAACLLGLWYNFFRLQEPFGHRPAEHARSSAASVFLCGGVAAQQLTPSGVSRLYAAAEAGKVEAQIKLGNALALGLGVREDAAAAIYWFKKGADRGDPEAQTDLGYMYVRGTGVPKIFIRLFSGSSVLLPRTTHRRRPILAFFCSMVSVCKKTIMPLSSGS